MALNYIKQLDMMKQINGGRVTSFIEDISRDKKSWLEMFDAEELLRPDVEETLQQLLDDFEEMHGSPVTNCNVAVSCYSKKVFKEEEIIKLNELNKMIFEKTGKELTFYESSRFWSMKDVKRTNGSIEKLVKDIKNLEKEKNFSPLEQFLYAYNNVAKRVYKEEDSKDDPTVSRSIYSVLNQDKIVCVGYASLLKEICNQIGSDNIQCFTNVITTNKDGKIGGHATNIVYLKDEKYGIDGFFYADACWDSVSKFSNDEPTFTFSLIPIQDVDFSTKIKISPSAIISVQNDSYDISCSGIKNRLYANEHALKRMSEIVNFDELKDPQMHDRMLKVVKDEKEKQREEYYETMENELRTFFTKPDNNIKVDEEDLRREIKRYVQSPNPRMSIVEIIEALQKETDTYISLHTAIREEWKKASSKIQRSQNDNDMEYQNKYRIFDFILSGIMPEYETLKIINPYNVQKSEFYPLLREYGKVIDKIVSGEVNSNNCDKIRMDLTEKFQYILSDKYSSNAKVSNIEDVTKIIVDMKEEFENETIQDEDLQMAYLKHEKFAKTEPITSQTMMKAIKKVLEAAQNNKMSYIVTKSAYLEKNHFDRNSCSSWLAKPVGLFINDMLACSGNKDKEFNTLCLTLFKKYKQNNEKFTPEIQDELVNIYKYFVNEEQNNLKKVLQEQGYKDKARAGFAKKIENDLTRLEMYGVIDTKQYDKELMYDVLSEQDNNLFLKLQSGLLMTKNAINDSLKPENKSTIKQFIQEEDNKTIMSLIDELEKTEDLSYLSMQKLYKLYDKIADQFKSEYLSKTSSFDDIQKAIDTAEEYSAKLLKFKNNIVGEYNLDKFDKAIDFVEDGEEQLRDVLVDNKYKDLKSYVCMEKVPYVEDEPQQ